MPCNSPGPGVGQALGTLSPRERELVTLVAQGAIDAQIAASPPLPEAAILHPGAERRFYLRADVRAVSREQAEGMTEFDAVTVRGLHKGYESGVVVDRLDFDVSGGEMVGLADADRTGQTITVECIQVLSRPGGGALRMLGHHAATGAARLPPPVGGQLQDSALPDPLRVAGPLDLFATPRARDGTELREQFGLGDRGRWGVSLLSGGERQRLFLVCALPGRPGRTS